jgi:hypothetical protein
MDMQARLISPIAFRRSVFGISVMGIRAVSESRRIKIAYRKKKLQLVLGWQIDSRSSYLSCVGTLGTNVADLGPHGSALILVGWIRIQEGKNGLKNILLL